MGQTDIQTDTQRHRDIHTTTDIYRTEFSHE